MPLRRRLEVSSGVATSMPRAFLKFRFRCCFRAFWLTGALTGALNGALTGALKLPARVVSPCNVTSPCVHPSDAEQNFAIEIEMKKLTLLFSLKIFEIVCTELLNCDCFGVWGFCTCCASLEEYQFGNLTSATFRLWHA